MSRYRLVPVPAFFDPANPARRPTWRQAGRGEGFRITGQRGRQWDVRRLSRKTGEVWVPKAGWVRFRLRSGWRLLVRRLEEKAPGRVEKVSAARNIAAGHPTHLLFPLHARGGYRAAGPANREPQLLAS